MDLVLNLRFESVLHSTRTRGKIDDGMRRMLGLLAFGEMLSREEFEMFLDRKDFCFPMKMVD